MNNSNLVNKLLAALTPIEKKSIVSIAEQYLKIKEGGLKLSCSFSAIPYFAEVAEQSAIANKIAIVAGARCGKTITLQAVAAAAICHYSQDVIFMQGNENALIDFIKNEFNANFSDIVSEFCVSDNQTHKVFKEGNFLNLTFPTSNNFRSRQSHYFLMTEFDAYEELHEGCLLNLAAKRTMVLNGCAIAESTPKFTAIKPASDNLHALPTAAGIVSVYHRGSMAWFYWNCPNCKEAISPNYKDVVFESNDYFVVCSKCGFQISEDLQNDLNAAGVWVHARQDKQKQGFLSYYLSPIFAAFLRWSDIYNDYNEAKQQLKKNQDSSLMRSFLNVTCGLPFLESEHHSKNADYAGLDNCSGYDIAVIPDAASFIYCTVDVQGGINRRFELCLFAACKGEKTAIVRRWSINNVNDQPLTINNSIEHFTALTDLLSQSFCNANKTRSFQIVCIGIDSGGEAGYLDNLIKFKHQLSPKQQQQFILLKGSRPFKNGAKTQKSSNKNYLLFLLDSNYFKSILFSRLELSASTDNSYVFYKNFPNQYKNEIASEVFQNGQYKKIAARNETLDLLVYSLAVYRIIGGEANKQYYQTNFSTKHGNI